MNPIPLKLRKELEVDPYYKKCCITGKTNKEIKEENPYEKLDFHHNFMWAGSQLNEKWCILPIRSREHKEMKKETKERLGWIMLNRASEETLKKYSKAVDLIFWRDRLNKKFGVPTKIKKLITTENIDKTLNNLVKKKNIAKKRNNKFMGSAKEILMAEARKKRSAGTRKITQGNRMLDEATKIEEDAKKLS